MKSTKWITLLCASVMACSMSVSAAPFDAAYYAENNPDVVKEVGYDAEKLAQHYYMIGIAEGRMGNAEDAENKDRPELVSFGEFDAEYYALQNPDVAAVCGADAMSLYMHYVNCGAAEGRMPSEKAKAEADKKAKEEAERKEKEKNQSNDPYARFKTSASTSKRKKSKSKSKEEPIHTLTYQSNENGTHDIICSVPDCSEGHNKTVACDDISYEKDSDEHHEHGDDIHYVICKDCGGKWEEACDMADFEYIDEKKHKATCTVCGYTLVAYHFRVWDSVSHTGHCEGCGCDMTNSN